MKERLFLPLSKDPFEDYLKNGKEVEIRKYGKRFSERTVFSGRRVELRLGYSGKGELWGNVDRVLVGSLEEIFNHFELSSVEPRTLNLNEAINENLKLLGTSEKYIAFSINIDPQNP